MKLTIVICLVMLSDLVMVEGSLELWNLEPLNLGSAALIDRFMPQIKAHDVFYPHPHIRDLKALAKRGKILVVTLILSAGLMALVSNAIIKSGKKVKTDVAETISLAELRACVIAAALAGERGLRESQEKALNMALSEYASARGISVGVVPTSATFNVGKDRVTVVIKKSSKVQEFNGGAAVEVRAVCGNMGASAVVDAADGLVESSVFTSHAQEREIERG